MTRTVNRDRVLESSTTTGLGPYSLGGAVAGFQSFAAAGDGATVVYCATAVDASGVPTGAWETGVGTYADGARTLARKTVTDSSNAGAPVDWPAGTKRVALGLIARQFDDVAASQSGSLSRLTSHITKQLCNVELPAPVPGGAPVVLANLTGAGIVTKTQVTISAGNLFKDARVRAFVDGETHPSIDVDLGTMMLTALSAASTTVTQGTQHVNVSMPSQSSGVFAPYKAMSGAIAFPIPYSNGCRIELYAPANAVGKVNGDGTQGSCYSQIAYQPGAISTKRLRSRCVSALDAVSVAANEQVTFVDVPQAAGWMVWLSVACRSGTTAMGYLERQQWIAVDGEPITPDGFGAINPSFATSGGEDLFDNGWYFSGATKVTNTNVLVTRAGMNSENPLGDTVAGIDLLGMHGGVRFNNRLQCGWSLKDGPSGNVLLVPFTLGYTLLYYVETTEPYAPSPPRSLTAVAGDGQAAWSWQLPLSAGSRPITGYTLTVNPGGTTYALAPNVFSRMVTGLSNGTAYTATVVANNAVGASAASNAAPATPAVSTVPGAPTGAVASPGNASAVVSFVAPASNGGSPITGYTATSTPGNFTGTVSGAAASPITVSGLTNGTAYTFTVRATNVNGNSAESPASGAVTPVVSTVADNFNRADGAGLGVTSSGAKTWQTAINASSEAAEVGIESNRAYVRNANSSAGGFCYAYVGMGTSAVDVSATLAVLGSRAFYSGILCRFVDANNHLHLQLNSDSTTPTGYVLESRINGTYTAVANIAVVPAAGDVLRIVMAAGSNVATVFINGTSYGPFTATGVSTSAQNVGLQGGSSGTVKNTVRWDNFVAA